MSDRNGSKKRSRNKTTAETTPSNRKPIELTATDVMWVRLLRGGKLPKEAEKFAILQLGGERRKDKILRIITPAAND